MDLKLILVLTTIVIFANAAKDSKCGKLPKKDLYECCNGVEKLFPIEALQKCSNIAKDIKDEHEKLCAAGYCYSTEFGLLKDDEIDKEHVLSVLKKSSDDPKWDHLLEKLANECSNPESKYFLKPKPQDKKCSTYAKGELSLCIIYNIVAECPTPKEDDECKKLFEYKKCLISEEHAKTQEDQAAEVEH